MVGQTKPGRGDTTSGSTTESSALSAGGPEQVPRNTSHHDANPPEVKLDDYLAHEIAQKAKTRIYAYFGIWVGLISVVVTLFGVDRLNQLIDKQYTAKIEEKVKDADSRITDLVSKFEGKLATLQTSAEDGVERFLSGLPPHADSAGAAASSGESTDLSPSIGAVLDQGKRATTGAIAVTYAMNSALTRVTDLDHTELSYWSLWVPATGWKKGAPMGRGTTFSRVLQAATDSGVYAAQDWELDRANPRPGTHAFCRITRWEFIPNDAEGILARLRAGKVVLMGVELTDEFLRPLPGGRIVLRPASSAVGAMAICVVGYDESTGLFKFAATWGPSWGKEGFGFITSSDLLRVSKSAHIIHGVELLKPREGGGGGSTPDG